MSAVASHFFHHSTIIFEKLIIANNKQKSHSSASYNILVLSGSCVFIAYEHAHEVTTTQVDVKASYHYDVAVHVETLFALPLTLLLFAPVTVVSPTKGQ